MDETPGIEVANELIGLCRAGRLYDIEKWIEAGRSLDISVKKWRGRIRNLLDVAVESGFHSMVELIVKHEHNQSVKDDALSHAVSMRRQDLAELLVLHGADVRAVPFTDVLLTWEPKLIRFFLDHGADVVTGRPFAEAFREKVRTSLRVFLECKQSHPELAVQLQEQIDCALRYFCEQGNLKWVSLLMWAGGDPRALGPTLDKDYTEDPECHTSGIEEACAAGQIDILRKLKLDRERDDLTELLRDAAFCGRPETLEYLLKLGANPNDKANGGSSALDRALHHIDFLPRALQGPGHLTSKYEIYRDLDCIKLLLTHGAKWCPSEAYEMNTLRRSLLRCQPDVTIHLLQMFRQNNACPAETVHRLLGTPKMKEHMASEGHALVRLGIHLEAGRSAGYAKRPPRYRTRI